MKQSRSFKAKLVAGGFTAAVALLCGLPNAYAAGPDGPGSGSTPGSFLVPGTNTSISFHGIVWVQATDILGTHAGDNGALGITTVNLKGPGAALNASSSLNGGFQIDAKPTRMMFSTSTPTGFGELKTYVEYDFDLIQGPQVGASNTNEARLRQAYGTLGPWLIGQTWSAFADLQSWGDGDDGDPAIDAGVPATTVNGRIPQVRYTFLGAGGLSVAGSLEMPVSYWTVPGAFNGAGQVTSVTHQFSNDQNWGGVLPIGNGAVSANSNGGIQDIPALAGVVNWQQPWGHLALHGVLQDLQIRNNPALGINNDISKLGYGVYLAGHLNTWGKDRLGGGVDFFHGAVNYSPFMSNTAQGLILSGNGTNAGCTVTTSAAGGALNGCSVNVADSYGVYANYEHFFTDAVSVDVDGGYEYGFKPDNTANWTSGALVSLEKRAWTGHVNLIWRPVPGLLSMTLMYGHWYREMWSGAKGNADAIKAQAKFFW